MYCDCFHNTQVQHWLLQFSTELAERLSEDIKTVRCFHLRHAEISDTLAYVVLLLLNYVRSATFHFSQILTYRGVYT